MDIRKIEEIINNFDNYSDEEILMLNEDIYNYLFDNFYFKELEEYVILLIKKIRDINTKIILIERYLISPFKLYSFTRAISNLSYEEKRLVFNKVFTINKFENITEILDIPNDLKLGLELEYSETSFNALELLFSDNSIKPLLDTLDIDDSISNEIVNNTGFDVKKDNNKWMFSVEMEDEHLPELSTPILSNNLKDLNLLKAFYSIMQTLDAKVSGWTSLQINVGSDYFNGTNGLKYLLSIWGECEELFYKISNKEGTTIRPYADEMAVPIKKNIQKTFEEDYNFKINDEEDFYRFLYNIQVRDDLNILLKLPIVENVEEYNKYLEADTEEEKYKIFRNMFNYSKKDIMGRIKCKSVNFNHMYNDGRIEFRLFNNVMDFETILLNITLVGRLMYVCRELSNGNYELLERYNELLNNNISEEEKLNLLLNLLFDDDTKDIFKRRWESVKDKRVYNKFYTGKEIFKSIYDSKQLKKTIF